MNGEKLFSQDNENAIFNIVLSNPDYGYSISDLKPSMFTSIRAEIIFNALKALIEQELLPDKSLLLDYLDSHGNLEKIGGSEYIEYLYNLEYNIKNFEEHKRSLVRDYKARSLISMSAEIPTLVKSNTANVDSLISNIRSRFDKLSEITSRENTYLLADLIPEAKEIIREKTENPGIAGASTGFSSLDSITGGFKAGDLWVIGSRPAMGKTSFACNSILRSARKGVRPLIFSLEMTKQTLIERLSAIDSEIDLNKINIGTMEQDEKKKVDASMESFQDLNIYLDDDFLISPEYVESVSRVYKKKADIDVVWIDYIQLLSERTSEQTHELGRISRKLKLLAKELEITFVILAQLNRNVELRDDKRPMLADIRQSGNLEEDPDIVAFLYRDCIYNPDVRDKDRMEFIIRKHRNGPVGTLNYKFVDNITKITEERI